MRSSALSWPLLFTVTAWGFNFVALKLVYREFTPAATSLIRFVITLVAMAIICLFIKEPLRYPKGDSLRILWLGFVSMGAYMILFLEGLNYTTPADSAIILSTSPIFTYFFAIVAKQEEFRAHALLGSMVAFAGVGVVILGAGKDENGSLFGNTLTLAASVAWAYSAVFSRPLMEHYTPARVFTLAMPGSLLVLIPYGILPAVTADYLSVAPITWAMMLHVSVLSGALGFTGFYVGVRQVGAAGAMLYQFLAPPLAMVCAAMFLGAHIGIVQVLGFVLVVIGVIGRHVRENKPDRRRRDERPLLRHRHFFTQINVLDRIQNLDSLIHWPLERLSSRNQSHPTCAFVDDSSLHRILQIVVAARSARINQSRASHVAIRDLIPAKIYRVIRRQISINAFIRFSITAPFQIERLISTVVLGQFLLYDVGLNGHAEMVCLSRQIRRNVIIPVSLEIRIPQIAPQNRRHPELVRAMKGLAHLDDLPSALLASKINGRADGDRSHVPGLVNMREHDLIELVRICEQLVVIELHDKRNLGRELFRARTQNTQSRSHRIASALDRQTDDVDRIEIDRIPGKARAGAVLHALIHRQNAQVSRPS